MTELRMTDKWFKSLKLVLIVSLGFPLISDGGLPSSARLVSMGAQVANHVCPAALLQCPLWIVKEKHSNFKSRSHLLCWHSSKHQHVDSIKLVWASLSTFTRYSDATHVGMLFESLFLSASVLTNRIGLREKNLAQLTNHCMVLPFASFSWVRVNITQTTLKIQQQKPPQRWEARGRILARIGFVLSLLSTGLLKWFLYFDA